MAARKPPQQPKQAPAHGKRIVTTRDELPIPPAPEAEQEDYEEEPPSELDILVAEFGGSDFEFAVFRMDPKAARGRTYAGTLPGSSDTFAILNGLQENFGGGTFELRVREQGGTFSRRITVAVEAPKKPEVPPAQQMQEQMSSVIKAVTEPMQQQMQQFMQQMAARPQFNFNDLLTKGAMLMPLLQNLRALLVPTGAAAAPTANDPLALLGQMQKMKEAMDLLGMSDREPDGIDRMMALFNSVGKPLLEKMQAAQAVRGAAPQRQPAPAHAPATAGNVVPFAPPVVNAPTVAAPAIPEALAPYMPMLLVAARGGETPESVAERILAAIPDNVVDPLADSLEDGSLVSALLLRPDFRGMEPWLNALARSILEGLSSGEESEQDGHDDVSGANGADASGEADDDT